MTEKIRKRQKKEKRSPWDRSYPEDPGIIYLKEADDAIAWRNKHAPGKEVWVTEFGYDACTPGAMNKRDGWFKKLNWQGVTDKQQAQYIIRSIFCFAARDVDRAYIYFFNDSDKASVHAASGLTRNFKPKPSFWAVKHLYETLGDYRFERVVTRQEGKIYAFQFRHAKDTNKAIWTIWSPTGSDRTESIPLNRLPGKLIKAEYMPLKKGPAPKTELKQLPNDGIQFELSESPIYLSFETKN